MMIGASGVALKPGIASDLDIQQWVEQHYGFVPHPFWIKHCRELYLDEPCSPRNATHGMIVRRTSVCQSKKLCNISEFFRTTR